MLLFEKVNDDLYVNPGAVDYVEVHRSAVWQVRIVFRGGNSVYRRAEVDTEASARKLAHRWQRLLNSGETP